MFIAYNIFIPVFPLSSAKPFARWMVEVRGLPYTDSMRSVAVLAFGLGAILVLFVASADVMAFNVGVWVVYVVRVLGACRVVRGVRGR